MVARRMLGFDNTFESLKARLAVGGPFGWFRGGLGSNRHAVGLPVGDFEDRYRQEESPTIFEPVPK